MTPQLPQLLKAVAFVVGTGIILRKFSWKEFPAFVAWMLGEVARQTATLGSGVLPLSAIFAEDILCAAAICEVIRVSRLKIRLDVQVRVFISVVAAAKILASIPDLTAIRSWYLFRSYFLCAAFATLLAITYHRWRYPVLERRPNQILRVGMTAWVGMLAVSGSFVPGGLGYKLFPYTMQTWNAVNVLTHVSVAVVVVGMSAAMVMSAPGRKRAALRRDGKSVCGRIEMQRVA